MSPVSLSLTSDFPSRYPLQKFTGTPTGVPSQGKEKKKKDPKSIKQVGALTPKSKVKVKGTGKLPKLKSGAPVDPKGGPAVPNGGKGTPKGSRPPGGKSKDPKAENGDPKGKGGKKKMVEVEVLYERRQQMFESTPAIVTKAPTKPRREYSA